MNAFSWHYRIFGSFGTMMLNIAERFDKMANGMLPVTDTEVPINVVAALLKLMECRHVFGTIGVGL